MRGIQLAVMLALAVYAGFTHHAQADDQTLDDLSLIETYIRADNTCRGSSGDDPRTIMACDIRDSAAKLLEARNFIWDEGSWQPN